MEKKKTPIRGAAKRMNVTIDLYKELEIDRSWYNGLIN